MGIQRIPSQDGPGYTVVFEPPFQGLFTRDIPTAVPDGYRPDLLNMDVPAGVPEMMTGSTLFATGMVLTGTPTFLGVWYSTAGVPTYVGANTLGEVYYWTGSAWTYLRQALTTSTTWWSSTRIGDQLVMVNKNDGNWKYDGTRMLPLGAKHIADMETAEGWAGSGAANTTAGQFKQGTQSWKLTTTGAAVTGTTTPSTALDLISGIGPTARDYTTSDLITFWVYFDTVTGLDTTNTKIRLGNAADTVYFQRTAAGWGTLSAGWNHVSILKSAFALTGAAVWSSIVKVSISLDSTGATINASFDDLYMLYAVTMPACQAVIPFKNMLIGLNDTAGVSYVDFSRVSAPDDWDVLATFPVADGDGDSIVGGRTFFDQFIVGKEHSIHSVYATITNTTYPSYRFSQTPLTYAYGLASHRSIVEAEGKLFWWTSREVVMFDGSAVTKLSAIIDPTVTPAPTRLPFIVGGSLRAENQLCWAFSPTGATTNTAMLRYDYVQEAWLRSTGQTLELLANAISGGVDLLLSMTAAGRVLQQNSGTTFDTVNISATLDLPWISGPDPERMVRWQEAMVSCANGTGTLTVRYRTANHAREMAGASYITAGTLTMSAASEQGRIFIGERSRWLQVQIQAVSGAWFQLLPPLKVLATRLPQRY